ncbi:DUF1015 family protein [Fusobacterium sp. SB021]|uniref:DUF1015 family protein n=1 Tax=Fusobacterium sp. SB021 TaxID=2744227 RepID=UPI003CED91F5
MKFHKMEKAYINISENLYPNDYINLARIENDKLAFNELTLFLSDEEKEKLNRDEIKKFENIVIIFKLENSWGILCNVPIKYYKRKKILCHELVLSDVIQRMLSNFHAYNTEANPVMLTHDKKLNLEEFVKNNKCEYSLEKEKINLFVYNGKRADEILNNLKDIELCYIADGHHRLFSTSLYSEKEEVMACVYEMEQLHIESIPRKIENISEEQFKKYKEKIENTFEVISNEKSLEKGEIKLNFNNEKLAFKLKNVKGDLFANNDIYRLNTQLISNIFRIFKDEEIKYLSESDLAEELKNPQINTVYIESSSMNKNEFMETVKDSNIMPPKSTYFKPKFPSFLVFNYFRK